MLNRSASLAMSTCILKALPGKLDNKRHSSSILYLPDSEERTDRASANSSLDTVRVSMEQERTGIPSAV